MDGIWTNAVKANSLAVLMFLAWGISGPEANDEIPESIKELRMGTLRIETAPGAGIRVRQLRHEFLFGCTMGGIAADTSAEVQENRQMYLDTFATFFNASVHEGVLKWYVLDRHGPDNPDKWARADTMLAWSERNDIEMRGHCIFWAKRQRVPGWVRGLPEDSLRQVVRNHAMEITSRYKGRIDEFDLNNEMLHHSWYEDQLGEGIRGSMFFWAKQGNPDAVLYLNDYSILAGGKEDKYIKQIRDFLSRGVPVGGIGCQGHFGGSLPDSADLVEELDSLAQFGLPIKVTEFDINTDDEEKKCRELRKGLTVFFGHPAVESVVFWGFWEGRMWREKAAMWDLDWTPRPSADTLRKILFEEWWTDYEGTADQNGICTVPAFFGKHRIELVDEGVSEEIAFSRSEGNKTVVIGQSPAGRGDRQRRNEPLIRTLSAGSFELTGFEGNGRTNLELLTLRGRTIVDMDCRVQNGTARVRLPRELSRGTYFLRLSGKQSWTTIITIEELGR